MINRLKEHLPNSAQHPALLWLLRILGIIIAIGLIISGLSIYWEYRQPPEEVVVHALTETLAAPSYTYHSLSKRILNGQEEILSEVWGEKNADSTHLWGKIQSVDSAFEIYQVNDHFYRQDAVTQKWLVVADVGDEATEKLLQEIDPMGVLDFSGQIEALYVGKEKVGTKTCQKYQIAAYNDNHYMTALWGDFFYTIWVDRAGYLRQAEIIATNKDHEEQQLNMLMQFQLCQDYLPITAPTNAS